MTKARKKKHRPAEQRLEALKLRGHIQEAAYLKAQQRDFEPGFELQDWLEAERELKPKIASAVDEALPKLERAQLRTCNPRGTAANG